MLEREQKIFEDVQQQRKYVQQEIKKEMQLADATSHITKQNFFTKGHIAIREEFQITNCVQLLQQKMDEKNKLMYTITPVLEQMKGKFYFNLSKRKQRHQLNKLNKTLRNDVIFLQKAIDVLLQ